MRIMNLVCSSLLMFSLVSCGLGEQDEKKEQPKQEVLEPIEPKVPEVRYSTIKLYEEEPFREELSIPNLREGDEIIIEIKGQSFQPKFSRVYNKSSISTWEEKVCIDLPFPKRKQCFNIPKKGNCSSKFKDHVGINKRSIMFKQKTIETRVAYLIGDQKFYFHPSNSKETSIFKAKLKVTKEMLDFSNDFYLKTLPREKKGKVKVGFLGFNKCEGILQPMFQANINQKSHSIDNYIEYEYLATVSIRYIE